MNVLKTKPQTCVNIANMQHRNVLYARSSGINYYEQILRMIHCLQKRSKKFCLSTKVESGLTCLVAEDKMVAYFGMLKPSLSEWIIKI